MPAITTNAVTVHLGDCLDVLRTLPDASIDSIVTDPPYGLSNTDPAHVVEALTKWANGDREFTPTGRGFMGKSWDAFVPPPAVWDECFRVLKPGGHLLAFAGSRTFDLMTLSIRFAGFDIRDGIAWLYGSGFPKSLDVSKAIDKAGGASPVDQSRVLREARERSGLSREAVAEAVGCTPSSVRNWEEGRARAVGRAIECITPSPQYRDKLADLLGYTADERRIVGVGGGSRGLYETGHRGIAYGDAATPAAQQWQGWGTALKPAFEPIVVARKPLVGTVAANVLAHGTGALNIDGCRVPGDVPSTGQGVSQNQGVIYQKGINTPGVREFVPNAGGRWPTNVVMDGDTADALDEQSGFRRPGERPAAKGISSSPGQGGTMGGGWSGSTQKIREVIDAGGGASRFFPTFRYQAKAPTRERPTVVAEDGTKTAHPTVKPLALMRWLVTLVTPPGGVVLDPFVGSGTTVEAAALEGFHAVGIEGEADYLPLIKQRLDRLPETAVE